MRVTENRQQLARLQLLVGRLDELKNYFRNIYSFWGSSPREVQDAERFIGTLTEARNEIDNLREEAEQRVSSENV